MNWNHPQCPGVRIQVEIWLESRYYYSVVDISKETIKIRLIFYLGVQIKTWSNCILQNWIRIRNRPGCEQLVYMFQLQIIQYPLPWILQIIGDIILIDARDLISWSYTAEAVQKTWHFFSFERTKEGVSPLNMMSPFYIDFQWTSFEPPTHHF